ncbi:MAG TPA: HIT domain-containing protein [Terriglobia bacterium]|nr:HIT domain-containing protein [Terriglobia bacterium]
MDYLWSPWRFRYVSEGAKADGCPFCLMARADPARDREQYILQRARLNFVFLNLYPYSPGHVLVAPYAHVAGLGDLEEPALHEMITLARRVEQALKAVYHFEGFNLGLNEGKCAGAGVADHIHLHALPRWTGDANFISVTGETRVLPEDLETTYAKLQSYFQGA